jgi:hypothetical protein
MISKKKFVMVASGAVLAAGIAIAVAGVVAGTAHAQGTSTFSIVGMSENSQDSATVQVSFTCTATAGTPNYEVIDVTATQGGTATGGTGNITCTGSAQTATITLGSLSGGMQFGTGQVQIGVTARYEDRSSFPYTYTFSGTTTTLSYTAAATTNP